MRNFNKVLECACVLPWGFFLNNSRHPCLYIRSRGLLQLVAAGENSMEPAEKKFLISGCNRIQVVSACAFWYLYFKWATNTPCAFLTKIPPSAASLQQWPHACDVCPFCPSCGCRSSMTGRGVTEQQHDCKSCRQWWPWRADLTLQPLCFLPRASLPEVREAEQLGSDGS